jgi:hypothetical protein
MQVKTAINDEKKTVPLIALYLKTAQLSTSSVFSLSAAELE